MSNLNIDFSTVNESTVNNPVYVKQGLQPLTIAQIVDRDGRGVEVTFETTDGAKFTHTFWISEKALPRLKYLISGYTGETFNGNLAGLDHLVELLVGKTANVVVDGEIKINQQGIKRTYATLRFAGFINPEGKFAEPIITDKSVDTTPAQDLNSLTAGVAIEGIAIPSKPSAPVSSGLVDEDAPF